MRKIETDILEKLKNKYGINKLRKFAELYGLGIPEKYWESKPTPAQIELIDDIIKMNGVHPNLVIWGKDVLSGNMIAAEMLKRLGKIKNSRYLDFVTIANEMIDKFGQMNMNLLNELGVEDVIVISNIQPYGSYYLTRVYPLFSSFVNSLANSILNKKIILVLGTEDDELDGIVKSYGDELTKTLNTLFDFYQLPSWVATDEKQ